MLLALKKPLCLLMIQSFLTQYHGSGESANHRGKEQGHLNKSEEGSLEEVMPDHQDSGAGTMIIFFTTQPCAGFLQGDQDVFIT